MQQFLDSWFRLFPFGLAPSLDDVTPEHRQCWLSLLEKLEGPDYQRWQRTPPGRLGLIILMGTVSKLLNVADSAFMAKRAYLLCIQGVEWGFDTQLELSQRRYFYEPLFQSDAKKDKLLLQKLLFGMRSQLAIDAQLDNGLALWGLWWSDTHREALQ